MYISIHIGRVRKRIYLLDVAFDFRIIAFTSIPNLDSEKVEKAKLQSAEEK